jgi:hypothetical protein
MALSDDGLNPLDAWVTVPISASNWQTVTAPGRPFADDEALWVLLRFFSNGDGEVATGPVVDDLVVEALNGFRVFFPMVMKRWPPVPFVPSVWIDPDNGAGTYTVNWDDSNNTSCPKCAPTHYRFQEATDPDFTHLLQDVVVGSAVTLQDFVGKSTNYSYFYRVQSINDYGSGDWSQSVSPNMPRYDQFSDPASGWHEGWAQRHNVYWKDWWTYINRMENVAEMSYVNGTYEIYVPMDYRGGGDADTWFVWPAEMAPLPGGELPDAYCIETRARETSTSAANQPWWSHWGIVFGADGDSRVDGRPTEVYTFQINSHGNLGIVGFHDYIYPGNRGTNPSGPNYEWPIYRWPGNDETRYWSEDQYGSGLHNYNTLRVGVDGVQARFYVNGQHVATASIPDMPRDKIGLIGGDFEVTPTEIQFDYFLYDPNCTP